MIASIGKNTPNQQKLQGFVDEIERVNASIKELGDSRTAIFATAKADGFAVEGIRYVIKARKMKPHDRQNAESVRDVYMHAMGLDVEPPLFRQIQAISKDVAGGDKLVEAFSQLVPVNGDIIVGVGGKRIRLWRDKDGAVHNEDYTPVEQAAASARASTPAPKKDVPDCSAAEARAMGEAAAKANVAVIDNPFPYGDERRPIWDEGWRAGSGNDGMGG